MSSTYFAGHGFVARVPPSHAHDISSPNTTTTTTTTTTSEMSQTPRLNSVASTTSLDSVDSTIWAKDQQKQQAQILQPSRLGLRNALLRAVRRSSGTENVHTSASESGGTSTMGAKQGSEKGK